jgi:hypothetical protein
MKKVKKGNTLLRFKTFGKFRTPSQQQIRRIYQDQRRRQSEQKRRERRIRRLKIFCPCFV